MRRYICRVVALLSLGLGLSGCVTVTREVRVTAEPRTNTQQANSPRTTGTPQKNGGSAEATVQSERIAEMESEVVRRVNQIRQEHGLQPLRRNDELARVARSYSRTMAQQEFFSHYGPGGSSVVDRVRNAGISFQQIAENLFKSVNVAQPVDRAVKGWMDSPGHRQNILREGLTETGVGIWKDGKTYHFTQLFMRPR